MVKIFLFYLSKLILNKFLIYSPHTKFAKDEN